jgi:malic enzyme
MTNKINRRDFIKGTAAFSAVTLLNPMTVFGSRANSAVRIGIIGTGGRGLSVIGTMSANNNIHIASAADLFSDKLSAGVKELNALNKTKGFPELSPSA